MPRSRVTSMLDSVGGVGRGRAGDRPLSTGAEPVEAVPGASEIVLVASGKGGVGKSTIAVNLACALQRLGLAVGLLDADLFGPSVARMLGSGEGLLARDDGRAAPALSHGVHSVSIGNLLAPEAAVPWKGPLVAQAIVQMFREVAWPDLDVLLVDLPPGTGDVPLTILEQFQVTGAVVVTTPERLSTVDAERAVALFHEHDIPVFGVVRNMGTYVCPCCGERQPLFETADPVPVARNAHVADLGAVPLEPRGAVCADRGTPIVIAEPDGAVAAALSDVARKVMAALVREQRARAKRSKSAAATQAFWERLLDD